MVVIFLIHLVFLHVSVQLSITDRNTRCVFVSQCFNETTLVFLCPRVSVELPAGDGNYNYVFLCPRVSVELFAGDGNIIMCSCVPVFQWNYPLMMLISCALVSPCFSGTTLR